MKLGNVLYTIDVDSGWDCPQVRLTGYDQCKCETSNVLKKVALVLMLLSKLRRDSNMANTHIGLAIDAMDVLSEDISELTSYWPDRVCDALWSIRTNTFQSIEDIESQVKEAVKSHHKEQA